MRILGIDPGMDGALALIKTNPSQRPIEVWDMPTLKLGQKNQRALDVPNVTSVIAIARPDVIAIEIQQPFKDQGLSTTGKTMFGYGALVGVVTALRLRHHLIRPQAWTKIMLAGLPKGKESNVAAAKRLWPTPYLWDCSKAHAEGRADALLIGEYTRRVLEIEP